MPRKSKHKSTKPNFVSKSEQAATAKNKKGSGKGKKKRKKGK